MTELQKHKKKMVAPIVVAVIMILYFALYFGFIFSLIGGIWKWFFGILPLLFGGIIIKVCIERIHEIRKGEEDDLSQY